MEQNTQPNKNNPEITLDKEGEPMIYNSRKNSKKKILTLILAVIILVVAGYAYFTYFNKEDEEPEFVEIKTEVLEKKKVEIDKNLDSDQDKLPDYLEKILKTAIDNPDTDGDGYNDFEEIKNGYSPLNSEKFTEEE
jgi:cell division protein FtsL